MLIAVARRCVAPALALLLLASAGCLLAAEARYWEGEPRDVAERATAFLVWSDDGGWHVRWASAGPARRVSGRVTCDAFFADYKVVRGNWRDVLDQENEATLHFSATLEGGRDGFDFRLDPAATKVRFELEVDGRPAAPDTVWIGPGGRHPPRLPFTIEYRER